MQLPVERQAPGVAGEGGVVVLAVPDPEGAQRLAGAHRRRVLEALAYFADPSDLVPDQIPGLGLLDDAIMVELVAQELRLQALVGKLGG